MSVAGIQQRIGLCPSACLLPPACGHSHIRSRLRCRPVTAATFPAHRSLSCSRHSALYQRCQVSGWHTITPLQGTTTRGSNTVSALWPGQIVCRDLLNALLGPSNRQLIAHYMLCAQLDAFCIILAEICLPVFRSSPAEIWQADHNNSCRQREVKRTVLAHRGCSQG